MRNRNVDEYVSISRPNLYFCPRFGYEEGDTSLSYVGHKSEFWENYQSIESLISSIIITKNGYQVAYWKSSDVYESKTACLLDQYFQVQMAFLSSFVLP